jgi:ribokinase
VLARQPGRKGANQAIAAARLGAKVALIGAVGDEPDGRDLIQNLADAGIDVAQVQSADHPTGTALGTV